MSAPESPTPGCDARCNGRYPVGHKRQEPFKVTYRCEKREGHTGQCGVMDESAYKEADMPRPRPTPGAWKDAHDALYEVIGQQHVLKHTLRFIRNWRSDPMLNPDAEIERAEKAIEEWHRRFVDAVHKSDALMVALSVAPSEIASSVTPSAVPTREWITCPATGQTCHEYCDPGQGDVCAKDGGPTPMFAPSAGAALTDEEIVAAWNSANPTRPEAGASDIYLHYMRAIAKAQLDKTTKHVADRSTRDAS